MGVQIERGWITQDDRCMNILPISFTFITGWLFRDCRTEGEYVFCPQYDGIVYVNPLDTIIDTLFGQPHPEARKMMMMDWR